MAFKMVLVVAFACCLMMAMTATISPKVTVVGKNKDIAYENNETYCVRTLINTMMYLCKVYAQGDMIPVQDNDPMPFDDFTDHDYQRSKHYYNKSVIQKCCHEPCALDELLEFC